MWSLLGCLIDEGSVPTDYSAPGSAGVGHRTAVVVSAGREVPIDVWYPIDAPTGAPSPIADLAGTRAGDYQALLDAAPAGCPSTTVTSVEEAAPRSWDGSLVVLSHCHGCLSFSSVAVAEWLASSGYVVAAPQHVGNTLWDTLDGALAPLDTDTLALRAADVEATLDAAEAGELGVDVRPDEVVLYGHSFGAVTVGVVAQARGLPAVFVGAPPDNPLLPGVDMAYFPTAVLYVELLEDNSVGEAGNLLIEANFEETREGGWLAQVADGGHWSPSDLVGLTEDFLPGCGEGSRQSDGSAFQYLDPSEGRRIAAALARAYVEASLHGDAAAQAFLTEPGLPAVTMSVR